MNPYDETMDELGQPPQAPKPQATNPYVQTLRELDQEADTRLRQSLIAAEDKSPASAREAIQLSERTGLPVDVIERNMDAIRKRAKIVDTPYAQMLRETPVLASFVSESPAVAAAVQDDMEQLGFLEWLTQAPGRAFRRGQAQVRFGQLSSQQLFRSLTAAEREQLAADKAAMQEGGQLGTGQSWFRGAITGAAEQLPNLFGAFLSGARYGIPAGVTAGTGAALLGQAGPQIALPEELLTVPAAFAGGFTAGTAVGAGQFGFELEAGLALDEYLEFKDEFGQPIDADVARAAALATGAMNAGLEAVGLGVLLKTVPGLKNLVAGPVTRSAVKQALRQPSVRAALGEAMKTYGTALSSETAVEMAQRAVTIMAGELAKVADGKNIPRRAAGDIVQDVLDEGAHALQAFSLLALPGPAMSFAVDARKAKQAKHNERFFTALSEGIAQSKTATELPEAAIAFLSRATKDGPIEVLYQPVDTFAQYWQSQGVDPREMATELTGDGQAFDRAIRTGEDLIIPTARYAVKLAATEHNAFFSQELRLGPEEMNARESAAFEQQMKGATVETSGVQPTAGPVRQVVVEQLLNSGIPAATAERYAELYESVFGTIAERAGMDATALFERYGLKIRRAGINEVEGAPVAAPAGAAGGSAIAPASASPGAPGTAPEAVRGGAPEAGEPTGSGGPGQTVPASPADVMAAGIRAAVEPLQDVPGPSTLPGDGTPATDLGALEGADLYAARAGLDAAAGVGLPDDVIQPGSPRAVGGGAEASGGTGAPVRGRAEIPASHAEYFNTLLDDARANGFTGSDDSLADLYLAALDDAQRAADELNADESDTATPRDLLVAIVRAGGFGIEEEAGGQAVYRKNKIVGSAGMVGELEHLLESLTKQGVGAKRDGRRMPIQFRQVGKLPGGKPHEYIVRRKGGLTADAIFEVINEDPRWSFESLADFMEAVNDAVMIETGQMKPRGSNRYTAEGILDQVFDVRPGVLWWAPPELLDPAAGEALNASGESSASLEAISRERSMRARGEQFVVYDRTGQRRPIIGVDAVDYVAQDGETYGIEGPDGFQVLDDRGGRVTELDQGRTGAASTVKPGQPFQFIRNTQKAPDFGTRYGQHLEPAGRYMQEFTGDSRLLPDNFEHGTLTFQNPLVVEFGGGYESKTNWKYVLSERFGGLTGKALSEAIVNAGHDGIVTVEQDKRGEWHTSEIVDLSPFVTAAQQQPRLPGDVGAVRDQEVAQPQVAELRDEFTLTPPPETEETQTTLFQPGFHGSPHVFDKFSLHAIGSGEGAQAYGWGLYFASRKEVAEWYRENITNTKHLAKVNARLSEIAKLLDDEPKDASRSSYTSERGRELQAEYDRLLRERSMTTGPAPRFAALSTEESVHVPHWVLSMISRGENPLEVIEEAIKEAESYLRADNPLGLVERSRKTVAVMTKLRDGGDFTIDRRKPGRTYTVELPEPEVMLDWDAAASQQPPKVQAVLRELGLTWEPIEFPNKAAAGRRMSSERVQGEVRGDIGTREAWSRGMRLLNTGDMDGFHRWMIENQTLYFDRIVDPQGWELYAQLGHALKNADPGSRVGYQELASRKLAEMGVFGLRYLDGASRSGGKGSHNFVIFDDSQVQITEFDQSALAAGTKLSALHQLTAENLVYADRLGGLPVPSVAVMPEASGVEPVAKYGDVTLVGTASMVDPKSVPVYDADIYSTTFPELIFPKPREAKFRAMMRTLTPFAEQYSDQSTLYQVEDSLMRKRPRPAEAASTLMRSFTGMAAFLSAQGMTSPAPVMRPEYVSRPEVRRAAFQKFIKTHGEQWNERPGSAWWSALTSAWLKSVEVETPKTYRDRRMAEIRDQYLDENGDLVFGIADRLRSSLHAIGKETIDLTATRDAFDAAIRGHESALQAWATDQITSLHGEPKIMVGGRQVPVTLENVVEAMTSGRLKASEETLTFGEGKARAASAQKIGDLVELRNRAEWQIALPKEIEARRAEVKRAMEDWRGSVIKHYRYSDTWDALDSSMKALARWATRTTGDSHGRLRAALLAEGFTGVPSHLIDEGVTAGRLFLEAPVPYFEAKPQRAVALEEFPGALIPSTASEATREILARRGITVEEYEAGNAESQALALDVLRARLSAERDDVLFQKRRGYLRFGPDRQMNMGLLESADLSTFLHESGHFYLEVFGDVAESIKGLESKTAEQNGLISDYEALLRWTGYGTHEQKLSMQAERAALVTAIQREGRAPTTEEQARLDALSEPHEKFARGFEAYLMSGEAPSIGLREAFAAFRAWLIGVYRSLKALNVTLTPEVTRVFNRMMATDAAILQAEQLGRIDPMFTTAESAGMSDSEFALYRETITAASQRAREQLDARLLTEVQRELSAEWKAKREEVQAAVTMEVHQRPVYQVLAAMRTGKTPDGQPLLEGLEPEPLKLSKAVLVDRFGAGRLKKLPKPLIYTVDGGMDPDIVADMFGFSSADEMLIAVEQAPTMREAIERETERRMLAEHGSILLDGTLHERATAAIANEDRDRVVRAELRALGQLRRIAKPFVQQGEQDLKAERRERAYERRWLEAEAKLRVAMARGEKQVEIDELRGEVRNLRQKMRGGAATIRAAIPPDAVIRQAARERIAATVVRQLRPEPFWSASRRAAQLAVEAAARGDFEGAITLKQQELMNLALFREASDARDDIEVRVRKARELAKPAARQRLGLAGESYLDQVDGILDRFSFAKATQKTLDRRASMAKWVAELEGEGLPVDLPDEVLDDVRRMPYQELTVEALIGVTDGLDQIVHIARLKNRLLKSKQQRELTAVVDEVTEAIRTHKPRRRRQDMRDRGPAAERRRLISSFFASHRKLASLAREMDGFQDGGPVWEAIIRPLNEAGDREASMNADATKRLGDLVNAAYPGSDKRQLYQEQYIPEIGTSLSKMHRLMVALNWGNEGNRERVRMSEKWDDRQVEAVLAGLTAADWQFVQGTLDLINSYWDEIAAKQKRVTGIAPTKVEATPIRTAFGEFRGGYFPIKYDDRLSATAAAHLDLDAGMAAKQAAYVKATTRRGHTKERAAKVKMPLRLDFGVITEHLQQVVHDLSHHEALIDVSRILQDRRVQSAIFETYGDVVYKQFKDGIRDIAFGDVPAVNGFEKAMNHLRTGATIAGLGWNLTTAALQPLGLTQSMVRIGPRWVVKGLTRWLRDAASMENTVAWITERSVFMRERGRTQQREINEIRNTIGLNTGKVGGWIDEALQKTTFNTVTRQGVADSYFFLIQQLQRVADVPTWVGAYEKAMASGETEDRAVALADQAVIDAQAGGQIKDLAGVQRGGPLLKLWTNFYSLFNTTYNLSVESVRRTKFSNPAHLGRLAVDYLLLYSIPASLGYLLREALQGGEDDDEKLLEGLIRDNLAYMSGTLLGFREFGGVIQGYSGYEGPAGARAFSAASRFARQLEQGELDEAFWRSLNDTAGILFHYPSGQVRRTIEGVAALAEGETENPAVLIGGPQR